MASRFILPFADVGSGILPSDGAKLFFFETGTSTPKDTFSDLALTTPNANPVIADSNGLFSDIFLADDLNYKVQLKDKNDVQIWESDPVVSTNNASAITYNQGGTGAVNRTMTARLQDFVTVADFGAVGDGVADDTTAVQAAMDAAGSGTLMFIPGKTYLLTDQLNPPTGQRIIAHEAILRWTAFGSTLAVTVDDHSKTGNGVRLLNDTKWYGGVLKADGVASPSGVSIPAPNFGGNFWNIVVSGHFNTITADDISVPTTGVVFQPEKLELTSGTIFGCFLGASRFESFDLSNFEVDLSSNSSDQLVGVELTWGGAGGLTYHPNYGRISNVETLGVNLGDSEGLRLTGCYDIDVKTYRSTQNNKGATFYIGDPGTAFGNPAQAKTLVGTGITADGVIVDGADVCVRFLGDGNGASFQDRKTNKLPVVLSNFTLKGNGGTTTPAGAWGTNVGILGNSASSMKIQNGLIRDCYDAVNIDRSTGGAFTDIVDVEIDNLSTQVIGRHGVFVSKVSRSKVTNCKLVDTNNTADTPNGAIAFDDATDCDFIENTIGESTDATNNGIYITGTSAGNRAMRNNIQDAADAYNYVANSLEIYGDNKADAGVTDDAVGFTKITNRLNYGAQTEVTIAAGAITLTGTNHSVDTEADAGADFLDNITVPWTAIAGDVIVLAAQSSSRTVNVTHAVGTPGTQTRTRSGVAEALDEGPTMFFFDGNAWWKTD